MHFSPKSETSFMEDKKQPCSQHSVLCSPYMRESATFRCPSAHISGGDEYKSSLGFLKNALTSYRGACFSSNFVVLWIIQHVSVVVDRKTSSKEIIPEKYSTTRVALF